MYFQFDIRYLSNILIIIFQRNGYVNNDNDILYRSITFSNNYQDNFDIVNYSCLLSGKTPVVIIFHINTNIFWETTVSSRQAYDRPRLTRTTIKLRVI